HISFSGRRPSRTPLSTVKFRKAYVGRSIYMNRTSLHNLKGFIALSIVCSFLLISCDREPRAYARYEPGTIEQRYGLTNAYSEQVNADGRPLDSTIVPITLS